MQKSHVDIIMSLFCLNENHCEKKKYTYKKNNTKEKIAIVKNNIAIRIAGKVSRYIDASMNRATLTVHWSHILTMRESAERTRPSGLWKTRLCTGRLYMWSLTSSGLSERRSYSSTCKVVQRRREGHTATPRRSYSSNWKVIQRHIEGHTAAPARSHSGAVKVTQRHLAGHTAATGRSYSGT